MWDISYNITISPPPDGRRRLSEVAICRIAGVDRNRRRPWAKHGLLTSKGKEGYSELDVAELAAFRLLVAELEFDRAREAWREVRASLKDSLLSGTLLVVFDERRAEGAVVSDPATLFAFAARNGSYAVVDISQVVADALKGFRNVLSATTTTSESAKKTTKVQHLRKKSPKRVV